MAIRFSLCLTLLFGLTTVSAADPPSVEVTNIRRVFHNGEHNSYPGFIDLSPTKAVVSWYSSHEKTDAGAGITAICLANLEIKESE